MSNSSATFRSELRAGFSAAMSKMYRSEVPAYGTLIDLVNDVNDRALAKDASLHAYLEKTDDLGRISEERHGAIRLGTAEELAMMRRIFAVMGMYPVGYYDLSVAGIPVHSTAFRPVEGQSLKRNPFRIFTSLLRVDLIADATLRDLAQSILARRQIFTDRAVQLVEKVETLGALADGEASEFISEVIETFKWHAEAKVDLRQYEQLHAAHRLIADVVSFRGPHINHLTPRTLDIDAVQAEMPRRGITPKAVVEGPPRRRCPILLRQTSFKAFEETVTFPNDEGGVVGRHTARFGEIEQRGAALTPKGRALYDRLLFEVRSQVMPEADGSNVADYMRVLQDVFAHFPDSWQELHDQGLAYFRYFPNAGQALADGVDMSVQEMAALGLIGYVPITYEDFLPVSAAGIFQSNLGDHTSQQIDAAANRQMFEQALGRPVLEEFAYYEKIQAASLAHCLEVLQGREPVHV